MGGAHAEEAQFEHRADVLGIHRALKYLPELGVASCAGPGDHFGELVYAGLDWVDPQLARRSMELMAQKVMPAVNAALGSA